MIKETEPFKTVLWILQMSGYWNKKSISEGHFLLVFLGYFLFEPLALFLAVMSFVHIKDVSDYARYFTFVCLFIMATGYATSFWLLVDKFNDLFNDLSRVFAAKPSSLVNLYETCTALKDEKKKKNIGLIVCLSLGTIGALASGSLTVPMWRPAALASLPGFFYFMWLYQSLAIFYIGFITTLFHDMFFDILTVINAYSNYFISELRDLDLSGPGAKERLVDCVIMHQNIQRLVYKFTHTVSYPISFQMSVGAYILCTTVFTINSNDAQAGFLITLGILILVQLLQPSMIAQQIESASESYASVLMECNWVDWDVHTQKLFLMFLQNLMFPILKFNLFGLIDVNLKTFVRILNATYSTYALLNNLT